MDKELIFYIVFGLIYLISRASRKKKQKQAQQIPPAAQPQKRTSPTQTQAPVSKGPPREEQPEVPMSFKDILRELSGEGKKIQEQPAPEPVAELEPEPEPEPEPVSSWESIEPIESLEQPVEETIPEYAFTSQEQNTADASSLWSNYKYDQAGQSGYRPSIHEEIKKEQEEYKFTPYAEIEEENTLSTDIREMLEDKDDFKKAVVLSEILKRKF